MKGYPRIGLDLDGVLSDFSSHFLKYLEFENQTPATDWDDPRFRENLHKVVGDDTFWLTMPRLIDPAILDFAPVIYVTARPVESSVTAMWLLLNKFPDAPVVTVGQGSSKVEALRGKVDLFIDDAYHNYIELNKAGIRCLLMTRSHNLKYDVGQDRIESLANLQANL